MRYLLYCIVNGDRAEPESAAAPILVRAHGCGAVMRGVSSEDLESRVEVLLDFARVIEAYDSERSVIPMRFGCVFDDPDEAAKLIERRGSQYREWLSRLAGNTEMSVQVHLRGDVSDRTADTDGSLTAPAGSSPGASYLERRRLHHARSANRKRACDEICEQIAKAVAGTSPVWTNDRSDRSRGACALHFLVPRSAVDVFVDAVRKVEDAVGAETRITGPWPAYHLVADADLMRRWREREGAEASRR